MSASGEARDELAPPGVPQTLEPGIVRVLQDNPGPFTGPGTNTFLLGTGPRWLLDPGEEDDAHHDALVDLIEATGDHGLAGVLVSHSHRDHWPLAGRIADRYEVPILAWATRDGLRPDRTLADDETLDAGAGRIRVAHTPGHCSDHLSFVWETAEPPLVLCGDHVMAWSTTILAPPDGDLLAYLDSLERLLALEPRSLLPSHGTAVARPRRRMEELRDHRNQRTRQLLDAVARRPGALEELVPRIYTDTDPSLHGAAAASLRAHVDALVADGRIAVDDDGTIRRTS